MFVAESVHSVKSLLHMRDGFAPWSKSNGIEKVQRRSSPSLDNHDPGLLETSMETQKVFRRRELCGSKKMPERNASIRIQRDQRLYPTTFAISGG